MMCPDSFSTEYSCMKLVIPMHFFSFLQESLQKQQLMPLECTGQVKIVVRGQYPDGYLVC